MYVAYYQEVVAVYPVFAFPLCFRFCFIYACKEILPAYEGKQKVL